MSDREKLKERIRVRNEKIKDRIKDILTSDQDDYEFQPKSQSAEPTKGQTKKMKLLDTYKMEMLFQYRTRSFVDRREQGVMSMPVDPKGEARNSKFKRFSLAVFPANNLFPKETKEMQKKNSFTLKKGPLGPDMIDSVKKEHEKQQFEMNKSLPQVSKIIELENDKKQSIMQSQVFNDYFSGASKFIEKIIGEEKTDNADKKIGKGASSSNDIDSETYIQMPSSFKNGTITHLNWSQLINNVFLTVYSEPLNTNVYDKLLIWNADFKHRPEFELHSTTKIQTAIFSPFHTEIIIAGLESGRVCFYDLRAKKDPVAKSGISDDCHKTQITGLQFIGTNNSSNLVSISEEGRMCIWNSAKLDSPRKVDFLSQEKKDNVEDYQFATEPLCISSIPSDMSSVFVGSGDGKVYQCVTESAQMDQSQKFYSQTFSDHASAVTCVHMSTMNTNTTELSGLMLSGSLDWTVKLWNPKISKPLTTFDVQKDSITDVHWNHAEVATFSMASVDGTVAVYNLLDDFENPAYVFEYDECVLNAKWDPSGKLLGVTDEKGGINIKGFKASAFQRTANDIENLESILKYQAK